MNGQAAIEEEGTDVEVGTLQTMDGAGSLGAVDRAAIDIQVATAKQYPRSVDKAIKEALTLATLDEDTAASMLYALTRSGKAIEGPSARLAEVMAYSWGNLRVDADVVAEDKTHVTAMGTCFDLEKNVAVRVRVKRRITDKRGRRYNEDMIGVTSNAAISIALRNSVFKVVPRAFVDRIYLAARKASLGEGGTITQKRQSALEWFGKLGVKPEQVFELLEVKGLDDVGEDQLVTLRGLVNAIKEGEQSVESIFHRSRHSEGTDELNEALKGDGQKSGRAGSSKSKKNEDPNAPPTDGEIANLKELLVKAAAVNKLSMEDSEAYELAISDKNGKIVRDGVRELSKALAGSQAGLDV